MKNARALTLCAILLSLALVLSYVERFIPLHLLVPLPGVKLGLANIVTLTALCLLGARYAYIILVLRCFLGALFGGGATALVFSLTGGLLALTTMALSSRMRLFSLYGVSILGAAAHNTGQILAAMVMMGTTAIVYYLPYLLIVGLFMGFLTGSACAGVLRAMHRGTLLLGSGN